MTTPPISSRILTALSRAGADRAASPEKRPRLGVCLACGGEIAPCLQRAASLRCHDCRDDRATIRAEFAEAA